jgi:hypothetical protein
MVNAFTAFFASFNPFIVGAAFSLGLIILVRTPDKLLRAASGLAKPHGVRSPFRRNA